MQKHRVLAVLALVLSCLGNAGAQVVLIKKDGDKTVMCMHSGLTSDLKDCGVRADWYAYVFVGSISAVTPVMNDEKEIQIVPEEVFLGAPTTPMTVSTSQAACLHELRVGDRWLFFLRKQKDAPIVLDYYGNESLPLADAQEQVETLRRLKKMGDFAILRGQVMRSGSFRGGVVPNAQVIAERHSDNERFVSITDADGRYDFQPLTPGKYKITTEPIGSYLPDDSEIDLNPGSCWDLTLSRFPHAQIGGHVRSSNGSPVPNVDLVLVSSDNSWYSTTQTDLNGHFMFDSQYPGEFVVGLNFPGRPDWFNGGGAGIGVKIPPASVFYPGVPDRSSARVIRLAADEKLGDIDFILPVQ